MRAASVITRAEQRRLAKALQQFDKARLGSSGDREADAAGEMADAIASVLGRKRYFG